MSKRRTDFINKLELFYRNFGNEWTLDDFISKKSQHDFYFKILEELEKMRIIEFNEDKSSFKIIDLPSNNTDLEI
jgi:hypothetical protein